VVASACLQPAETATTVRVQAGKTVATDGPFAETKEVFTPAVWIAVALSAGGIVAAILTGGRAHQQHAHPEPALVSQSTNYTVVER
jgi:hypothetical protein